MEEGKSFKISKHLVLKAYKCVKSNKGAGGVDGIDFEKYEANLKDNLYKLWNRMSSGSYFPKPVKGVEIPKRNGKVRLLGIPTIEDRVAQMVVRMKFEPIVEPIFYEDSYGYRPDKSAIDAVAITRQRCWKTPWVIEYDIVGLFDNIDHEKMMKAVRYHTDEAWVLLYVERFLKASMVLPTGEIVERISGTPQGGVISPVLSNLFLHYALDRWISNAYPQNQWARYADDGIIHCRTEAEAKQILEALKARAIECGLEIHPEKSKIVYCRSDRFNNRYENESFDFLGYTFRRRYVKSKNGNFFNAFSPSVSKSAAKTFRSKIKEIRVKCTTKSIEGFAELINPIVRGWMNYFTVFCAREAQKEVDYVNQTLASNGHALVLFTSYKPLRLITQHIKEEHPNRQLIAMNRGRNTAIDEFKESQNAVIFATGSMWEGVNIPGDVLSHLIIVKLPFPIPDPISDCEKSLYSDMNEYLKSVLIPKMLIKLRQGVGRLIRSEIDTGVISILDVRVGDTGRYHQDVLHALPECRRAENIEDIQAFLKEKKDNSYFE